MEWIKILAGPLIGAVIGYCTNYIAVKMLFRPLHPVKVGNWTLPFTPGIIPRGKARLAKALGNAVGEHLLTKEDLEQILEKLSESSAYGVVLRAKGIVPSTNGWLQFDLTPGEYEIREGAADYTGRLCVIGSELKEDELLKLFQLA